MAHGGVGEGGGETPRDEERHDEHRDGWQPVAHHGEAAAIQHAG